MVKCAQPSTSRGKLQRIILFFCFYNLEIIFALFCLVKSLGNNNSVLIELIAEIGISKKRSEGAASRSSQLNLFGIENAGKQ